MSYAFASAIRDAGPEAISFLPQRIRKERSGIAAAAANAFPITHSMAKSKVLTLRKAA